MPPVLIETASSGEGPSRFSHLRGVRWRIGLGILPSSPSASIDDLRRVTANSRRRYAALRRQLLVDPHIPKDGSSSPELVMDNPLSQDPDSMWGRFFRNAELERMVDQDLTRLYPEHGSYFQTAGCQSMLRRILLLWCLRHPEYGYRQGMHEVLAPLLYVLHVDVEYLLEVRKLYEDYFTDQFDGFSFHENDLTYKFDFKKFSESLEDGNGSDTVKISSLSDLDPKLQAVILISDAYGAEGELGVLLSEKFMEHDAYCMFDALMNGAGGAVSMAEFFSPLPISSSHSGFPPVIEASATMYHLLSIVDSSIHSHLVELGVEPQYFALRWLRVLFGREFALEDLLEIWDEIFACENTKLGRSAENDAVSNCTVLDSSRGAFISAFAVSMILNLRSSLLATENATSCLQRLLNFPDDVNLGKLIRKAKSLQPLAMEASNSIPLLALVGLYDGSKLTAVRGHNLSSDTSSPKLPLNVVPDSYWEEKWRVLHKEEERKQGGEKQVSNRTKGWSEKVRLRLSRTESEPSPKVDESKKNPKSSVRRSLLADLARQLGSDEDTEKLMGDENLGRKDPIEINGSEGDDNNFTCITEEERSEHLKLSRTVSEPSHSKVNECKKIPKPSVRKSLLADLARQLGSDEDTEKLICDENVVPKVPDENSEPDDDNNFACTSEQRCFGGHAASDENFSISSESLSAISGANDHENGSERSSIGSNFSVDETYSDDQKAESCGSSPDSPLPVSGSRKDMSSRSDQRDNSLAKSVTGLKERMLRSGKFQWLLKLGRHPGEGTSEKEVSEATIGCNGGSGQSKIADSSTADACRVSSGTSKGETVDQNLMVTLRNLGQSMLDNIQVIELVFQQDRGQAAPSENLSKNALVGRGQVTAITALKELRKISNLLSEL